jgi:hypothetical protein
MFLLSEIARHNVFWQASEFSGLGSADWATSQDKQLLLDRKI